MNRKIVIAVTGIIALLAILFVVWNIEKKPQDDSGVDRVVSEGQTTKPASKSSTKTTQTTSVIQNTQPLYFSSMTHMEGNFKDDTVEALFDKHVADIRWAMDLFDEYGAKLTIESGESFAKANGKWGTNILKEVLDAGHGVGTHADFGVEPGTNPTLASLTEDFKRAKKLVDDLVGAENNRGVSGGTSSADWVLAASTAGFKYMDAVTAFGYLSMPLSARPDGWTDAYIRKVVYHDPIPPEFSERIYPKVLADATDLESDEDGVLTVLGGDIGELASLAEGRSNCLPNCTLDEADVAAVVMAIEQADSVRDPSLFARLNVHIPLVLLNKKNETTLRSLLSQIQSYAKVGTVTWGTQRETHDAFQMYQ